MANDTPTPLKLRDPSQSSIKPKLDFWGFPKYMAEFLIPTFVHQKVPVDALPEHVKWLSDQWLLTRPNIMFKPFSFRIIAESEDDGSYDGNRITIRYNASRIVTSAGLG